RLSAPLAVRPAGLEELAMVCDRCGTLLNGEDVAQRLLQKQERLFRFGLIGFGPPLLWQSSMRDVRAVALWFGFSFAFFWLPRPAPAQQLSARDVGSALATRPYLQEALAQLERPREDREASLIG